MSKSRQQAIKMIVFDLESVKGDINRILNDERKIFFKYIHDESGTGKSKEAAVVVDSLEGILEALDGCIYDLINI